MIGVAHASPIGLNPGLWEVKVKIKNGDQEVDPQAEVKKAMANMPPEQRKQMEAVLAQHGAAMGGDSGMKVCFTAEQLADGKFLGHRPHDNCESSITHQSSSQVAMSFKCKDGTNGSGEWKLDGKTTYSGHMKMTKKDGKLTEITQVGKFVSADCGNVKSFSSQVN